MLKTATEVPATIEPRAAVPVKEGLGMRDSSARAFLALSVGLGDAARGLPGRAFLGEAREPEDGRGRHQHGIEDAEVDAVARGKSAQAVSAIATAKITRIILAIRRTLSTESLSLGPRY